MSGPLRSRGTPRGRVGSAALLLVAIAGCSAEPSDGERSIAEPPVDPDRCRPELSDTKTLDDVEGRAVDATLWALPFAPQPFRAGRETKIVWRMTGSGPPHFVVTGPDGVDADALRWGPEAHADSSWERPGDEWGTAIRFAEPGCWRVTVSRDEGTGSVWFAVA